MNDQVYLNGLLVELSRAKESDPERVPAIIAELQRVGHPIKAPRQTRTKSPEQSR